MDLNLDTLKREIVEYLEASNVAVFRSTPGGLEGLPIVLWDSEGYPDYRMFLDIAQKIGTKLILVASRGFDEAEIDEAIEQLQDCDLSREERRDLENRLGSLRPYVGVTCSLELAFDYHSRLYVYELRPDWYEEFLSIGDEIAVHLPDQGDDDDDDSLGGYFSNN
ncbi:MAG TPA: hypothetical protein VFA33_20320 [Bryobacteraceae bacterium]|nr:hypothetical protein [Bryobacteraceae bacterium]